MRRRRAGERRMRTLATGQARALAARVSCLDRPARRRRRLRWRRSLRPWIDGLDRMDDARRPRASLVHP